jgi:hypothetical protein
MSSRPEEVLEPLQIVEPDWRLEDMSVAPSKTVEVVSPRITHFRHNKGFVSPESPSMNQTMLPSRCFNGLLDNSLKGSPSTRGRPIFWVWVDCDEAPHHGLLPNASRIKWIGRKRWYPAAVVGIAR